MKKIYRFFFPALLWERIIYCIVIIIVSDIHFIYAGNSEINISPKYGHHGPVLAVAFSPRGNTFVSGGTDKSIKIWSFPDKHLIKTLYGHSGHVNSLAFSPDGEILVSAGSDGTIIVWSNNYIIHTFKAHKGAIKSIAVSPNGEYLASAGIDSVIKVWSLRTFSLVKVFNGHQNTVSSVVFSPDGEKMVSGGYDNSVRIWPLFKPDDPITIEGHSDKVLCVSFSPDGSCIASSSCDNTVKLWNPMTGQFVRKIRTGMQINYCCRFSPDSKKLFIGNNLGEIRPIYLQSTNDFIPVYSAHSSFVMSMDVSSDGSYLISGGWDGKIFIWKTPQSPLVDSIVENCSSFFSITSTYNPITSLLAAADGSEKFFIFSLKSGKLYKTVYTAGKCYAVSFSGNGNILAAGYGRKVKLFEPQTGRLVAVSSRGHSDVLRSIAFSPNNSMIATLCGDNTILVHLVSNGKTIARLRKRFQAESFTSMTFVPQNGDLIISGSNNGNIRVWTINNQKNIQTIFDSTLSCGITSVAFTPSGAYYAVSASDGAIQVRSFPDHSLLCQLNDNHEGISSLCYSSDNSLLASLDYNGNITIRSATDYSIVSVLPADQHTKKSVIFAGNTTGLLISGGNNRSLRYHSVKDSAWLLTTYLFNDSDYICYNREGYFTASENVRNNLFRYIDCLSSDSVCRILEVPSGYYKPETIVEMLDTINKNTFKGPGMTTFSSRPVVRTGKKYAIVVGIAEYKYLSGNEYRTELSNLKYSAKDAEAFRNFFNDVLRSGGGWDIRFLTNEKATTVALDNELTTILTRAEPEDLIYIFFSGHARSHPLQPGEVYLLTYDFQPDNYRSGFSYKLFMNLISESRAGHVVAFIDACKSGMIGFKGGVGEAYFNQDDFFGKIGKMPENKIIFTSASGSQVSWEDDEFRMGTFTYYLIEGLKGCAEEDSADINHVNLGELFDYVKKNVEQRTRSRSLQTPDLRDWIGSPEMMLPLAKRIKGYTGCYNKLKTRVNVSR